MLTSTDLEDIVLTQCSRMLCMKRVHGSVLPIFGLWEEDFPSAVWRQVAQLPPVKPARSADR